MAAIDDLLPYGSRSYLIAASLRRITATYRITSYSASTVTVAAVHYLYGAEFYAIHGGNAGTTKKHLDATIDNRIEPYIGMRAAGMPILTYENEDRIVFEHLQKKGYTHYWPYLTWPTPEGVALQGEIGKKLKGVARAPTYRKWTKLNEKFLKQAARWIAAYARKYSDTPLKYWRTDFGAVALLIPTQKHTEHPSRLTSARKRMIHDVYEAEMSRYAEFLIEGFCARSKLFPRTPFE